MASVASQLIEEVTAHAQSDSLEDAQEICADGIYFPNNLRRDIRTPVDTGLNKRSMLASLQTSYSNFMSFNLPRFNCRFTKKYSTRIINPYLANVENMVSS